MSEQAFKNITLIGGLTRDCQILVKIPSEDVFTFGRFVYFIRRHSFRHFELKSYQPDAIFPKIEIFYAWQNFRSHDQ